MQATPVDPGLSLLRVPAQPTSALFPFHYVLGPATAHPSPTYLGKAPASVRSVHDARATAGRAPPVTGRCVDPVFTPCCT
jgi:hypothetical protein